MMRIALRAAQAGLLLALLVACGGEDAEQQSTPAPSQRQPDPASSATAGNASRSADGAPSVSKEQAGKIVTDKYGGEVLDIESDTARGEPSWEVEVRNSDQGRIEVDVSQSTGEIVEMESD